jgi:single-strand DNA-binding protein
MSVNMIVLTGRLTADPELKYTQSGKAYAKFSLAVSRRYNREETDFVNIVCWEKKAELVSQYINKGSLVAVTGSLRIRSYEDEKGAKKKITEVLADNIEFLEKKSENLEKSSQNAKVEKTNKDDISDDDFPF